MQGLYSSISEAAPKAAGRYSVKAYSYTGAESQFWLQGKEIRGACTKQGGERDSLMKKDFHRISEKSSKKIFYLLQGQNKGFLRLLMLVGYNSLWETAHITKRLLQGMWWHGKSEEKKKIKER